MSVAVRGGHEQLLAQLLGSLLRDGARDVTFLRVLSANAGPEDVRRAKRDLSQVAAGNLRRNCHTEIVQSDDPLDVICSRANESDLLMLGVQRHGRRKKLFGDFTREISRRTTCPLIIMSRGG